MLFHKLKKHTYFKQLNNSKKKKEKERRTTKKRREATVTQSTHTHEQTERQREGHTQRTSLNITFNNKKRF